MDLQVIVGTFLIDSKKDSSAGLKIDASGSKMPSPVGGASISSVGFRSPVDSSGRNPMRGNDDYQPTIGGSHFMMQSCGMNVTPSRAPDWRTGLDARNSTGFDMSGIISIVMIRIKNKKIIKKKIKKKKRC